MANTPNSSPKTSTLILVVLLLPLLALSIIIALQTIYHAGEDATVARRAPAVVPGPAQGYAWLDRKKGIVRIPIERAMVLVVDEAGGQRAPQ